MRGRHSDHQSCGMTLSCELVDFQVVRDVTAILNEASLRNLFMKKVTREPGGADDLRQCSLANLLNPRLGLAFLSEVGR
jgi:hypothetical protein